MILRIFVLVLLATSVNGCLKTFSNLHVKRDGSAVLRDSIYLTESIRESGPPSADSLVLFQKKLDSMALKNAAELGPNVTVRSTRIVNELNPTGWVTEYNIPSISDLTLGRIRTMKMVGGEAMAGMTTQEEQPADEPMRFSYSDGLLEITNPPAPKSTQPVEQSKPQTKEEINMAIDMMQTFMGGLRIALTVSVDPPLLSTNATSVTGSTITIMDVDFDKLMKVWRTKPKLYRSMQGKHPGDPAGLQKAMKSLPKGTLTFETREKIVVKF